MKNEIDQRGTLLFETFWIKKDTSNYAIQENNGKGAQIMQYDFE